MFPSAGRRCRLVPRPALVRGAVWVALAGFTLAARPARALDPALALTQVSEQTWREELPQASVNAIHQTRDGYLWLGTYEGLVRWNGLNFRVFDRDNTPALKRSAVWALLEDRSGTLWIATLGGGVVRGRGDDFTVLDTSSGLSSDTVYALFEDRDGAIWIGTAAGIDRWQDGKLENVAATSGLGGLVGLAGQVPRAFAQTRDGDLWLGYDAAGLFRLHDGTWRRYQPADGLAHPAVTSLEPAEDGSLWVGTLGGLQRWDGERFTTYGAAQGLENPRVWTLHGDRDGQLWVGTEGGGLHRFRAGRFESLRSPRLPSDIVRALEIDREGSLWVGTNGGLTQLRTGTFSAFGARDGLAAEQIRTVFEDSRGRLWVGSDGGGLAKFQVSRFVGVPLSSRGERDDKLDPNLDQVRALAEDRDGRLWVGTAGAGLVVLPPEAGDLARPDPSRARAYGLAEGLPNLFVRSILAASDGAIWVGTNGGLAVRRAGETRFTSYPGWPPAARTVIGLLERRDGSIWAATAGGGVLEIRGDQTRVWGREQGLPADNTLALFESDRGDLWIGTQLGLARLRDGVIETFGRSIGLPEQAFFAILDGGDGAYWLSSNGGVLRLDRSLVDGQRPASAAPAQRADGSAAIADVADVADVAGAADLGANAGIRRFGRADGMPSRQCNGGSQPAAFRAHDGRLWFATTSGLATVDPRFPRRNEVPPPVAVESVWVDGVMQSLPNAGRQPLELAPGTRRVEIDFAALSFTAPERVHYRFRLEGFDDRWRDAFGRHRVEYTRLAPGPYAFRVQAANADGVWNDVGATVHLDQRARLHQRPGFWFTLLLAAGVLAAILVRWRLERLTRRQRELERAVDEKTQALSEQMERVNDANARLAEANQKLEVMALIDPLTGLANRRRFEDTLATEWSRARRAGTPLALALFDVDAFKAYNDNFGHPEGDRCLSAVAAALASELRRGDLVARWGGEEFALLLPGAKVEDAVEIANEIAARVENLRIDHRSPPAPVPFVTVSAGVASLRPQNGRDPEDLLRAADEALYEAKRQGRRRVVAAT
jgi:diguanylate cyclase (GGDEF)-like protein